jgi:hypothetical protein
MREFFFFSTVKPTVFQHFAIKGLIKIWWHHCRAKNYNLSHPKTIKNSQKAEISIFGGTLRHPYVPEHPGW